jgi:hypothetical protein
MRSDAERSFSSNEHHEYTVGRICALPIEMAVAEKMLDEANPDPPQLQRGANEYTLGKIGVHNVVIA